MWAEQESLKVEERIRWDQKDSLRKSWPGVAGFEDGGGPQA
jgi:hypothetical protein